MTHNKSVDKQISADATAFTSHCHTPHHALMTDLMAWLQP